MAETVERWLAAAFFALQRIYPGSIYKRAIRTFIKAILKEIIIHLINKVDYKPMRKFCQ